jgi:hypothetical protein
LIGVGDIISLGVVLFTRLSGFVVTLFSHEMICDRKNGYFSHCLERSRVLREALEELDPIKML